MPQTSWQRLSRLADIPDSAVFADSGDPFLSLAFLLALEEAGVVGTGTAWAPCHLLFLRDGHPAALLPLYRKRDSRGEYVFDQGWATAYHRHGLAYYPKLVTAIPFTPVPGPRLLLALGEASPDWLPAVFDAVREECRTQAASGWHGLFVEDDWVTAGTQAGLALREGVRFHWSHPGHASFEDFLATLTSKKRKDIRRERRRLAEVGIHCHTLTGTSIRDEDLDFFHACYVRTYQEHGQVPYLNRSFFNLLREHMAERLSLVVARDNAGPMASALFLHQDDTLYGRYWGCLRRADGLHFEVCYYQGMELCLRLGLHHFDPGTQGEHKLLRGFAPRLTYSLHWLAEPGFQAAVQDFVQAEQIEMRRYLEAAREALPFRQPDVINGAAASAAPEPGVPVRK